MALLFGATWMVNSIVFFAILTMILLSNLYVLAVRPRRLWPYYALLLAALLVNSVIPMDDFLSFAGHQQDCWVVHGRILAGVLRRRDLRDGFSLERAARRRFRLQHRRHHPGRPERVPLAHPGVQSSALDCDGLLLVVGVLGSQGFARGMNPKLATAE